MIEQQELAQTKYSKKRQRKAISIDLYQDNETEKFVFESWSKESDRKGLFIEMYLKHLKQKES